MKTKILIKPILLIISILVLFNNDCYSQLDTIRFDSLHKYYRIKYGNRGSDLYKDNKRILSVNFNINGDTSDVRHFYYERNNVIEYLQMFNDNKILWGDSWELNDQPFGIEKTWYPTGELGRKGSYKCRCDGDTSVFENCFNRYKQDGKWSYYYKNGNLERVEYYDCGVKIYIWKYWTEKGKLIKEEEYREGILIKKTEF